MVRIFLLLGLFSFLLGAEEIPTEMVSRDVSVVKKKARKAAKKSAGKLKKSAKKPTVLLSSPPPPPVQVTTFTPPSQVPKYRFNSYMGLSILGVSGIGSGVQFGVSLSRTSPWYVGPELGFSLFSPGSIFTVLGSVWREFRLGSDPKLGLMVGLLAGPAFTSLLPQYSTTELAAYLDLAISQQVNDLVSVRGQLRPGIVAKNFAFLMAFEVAYRFY